MIESTQVPRMGAEAAREVWKALGVADRMGVTEEDTPHCRWHEGFTPDLEAYLDRFLLGRKNGRSTDILRSKFTAVDRATWVPWKAPLAN
jgi:hypothetical protein